MSALPSTAYIELGPRHMPEVTATVRLTSGSWMYCHTYPDSAPVVSITDSPVKIAITVPDAYQVTSQDVERARQLAALLTRYIAELEQLATPGPKDEAGRAA